MIGPMKISELDERTTMAILDRGAATSPEAEGVARAIIADVRRRGLEAVVEYERRFGCAALETIEVPASEIKKAEASLPKGLKSAIIEAAKRIESFQRQQLPKGFRKATEETVLGQTVVPLRRVGVYAPGGTARYPSSVLMGGIPAKVAGVREIALCTPADKEGKISAEMLFAAKVAGATEVYRTGGAQAIAAMAYGAEGLGKVDKIVGPGNRYVTAAKALVRNDCPIDFLAGPSEVLVVADGTAKAELVALELVAQLEHDADARAILVTTSSKLASEVKKLLPALANRMPRTAIVNKSMAEGCALLVAGSMEEAFEFANSYAPEHLLLALADPEKALPEVRNAGSVFLGLESAVAFGDYCAGPNHILPTMGNAASFGALSPSDFVKLVPYQRVTAAGARRLAPIVGTIARAEGLEAHALAAGKRGGGK